ncbi:unnamed protein product [Acanthoscelides obtectus]|uniref:Uncharacterized protein n=1 Tax=Acanthoscelides obtectus TaxID=200917 RepID=A0A9P0MHJ1_ACAOB|nr:unnamed protein product [Acanthoscelides obtectus]CAK1638911.1 hypothetical protein AOBTE_LOCUS10880 [Acanthoscelides obtectus]
MTPLAAESHSMFSDAEREKNLLRRYAAASPSYHTRSIRYLPVSEGMIFNDAYTVNIPPQHDLWSDSLRMSDMPTPLVDESLTMLPDDERQTFPLEYQRDPFGKRQHTPEIDDENQVEHSFRCSPLPSPATCAHPRSAITIIIGDIA